MSQPFPSTAPSKKKGSGDWSQIHCPKQFSIRCSINSVSGEKKKKKAKLSKSESLGAWACATKQRATGTKFLYALLFYFFIIHADFTFQCLMSPFVSYKNNDRKYLAVKLPDFLCPHPGKKSSQTESPRRCGYAMPTTRRVWPPNVSSTNLGSHAHLRAWPQPQLCSGFAPPSLISHPLALDTTLNQTKLLTPPWTPACGGRQPRICHSTGVTGLNSEDIHRSSLPEVPSSSKQCQCH